MPRHVRLPILVPSIWVIATLSLGVAAADARTWRVAKDGSGDFSVIQPAVDAAAPGDTVFIAAGRYAECETTTAWSPPDRVACVVVSVDSLTLIGENPESVIIGPAVYDYWNYGPVGIGDASPGLTFMRLEGLGFTNNYMDILKKAGDVEIRDCRFEGSAYGINLFDVQGGLVEACLLEGCISGIGLSRCVGTEVRDCRLVDCAAPHEEAIYVMTSSGVSIQQCDIEGGFVGIGFHWCEGSITRCQSRSNGSYGFLAYGRGTDLLIEDCRAGDSPEPLRVDALATVRGNRDVFRGGSMATLSLRQSTVTLRDCHILNGGAWSVRLDDDIRYSPGAYDLAGNWWGTTDSAQIDAWIYDAHDNAQVGAVVQYLPILDHPVGVERKTLGGIKGMFR